MKTIFTLLIATVVLCSCNSTRLYQEAKHPKLNKENLEKINGIYTYKLWHQLNPTTAKADKNCSVKLTVLGKHKIRTELIRNNDVVSSATLKGKLRKNGYYSINPCINLIPTPFLFVFKRNKQDIILTEKNDLHVAYSKYGLSVILLMASGSEDRGAEVYERRQ
ncbi:MAG TPA: hypothetical protein VFE50_22325 [Cyclobacteriaceae bacterium]|nr:hypothetical protein [Cyclobacteriaceae bacterium]